MRAQGLVLSLLSALALMACQGTGNPQSQDRNLALGQISSESKTALPMVSEPVVYMEPVFEDRSPTAIAEATDPPPLPPEGKSEVSAAQVASAAPIANPVVSGKEQSVWITFYYCERSVDKSDDGGGYCGNTASGIPVHPGSSACPRAWMGRSFSIPGDPNSLTYKCEDVGSGVVGNHVDIWFKTNGEGWSSPLTGPGREIIWQD